MIDRPEPGELFIWQKQNYTHKKIFWGVIVERVGGAAFRPAGKSKLTEEDKKEAEEMVKRMKATIQRQMKTGKIL